MKVSQSRLGYNSWHNTFFTRRKATDDELQEAVAYVKNHSKYKNWYEKRQFEMVRHILASKGLYI